MPAGFMSRRPYVWLVIAVAFATATASSVSIVPATAAAATPRPSGWTPPADAVGRTPDAPNPPEEQWTPPGSRRLVEPAGRAPAGTVAGAPGLGELPWFSFQNFELSGDTSAKVNLANGNLLIAAADATIGVPGFGLRADRYYNGLSTAWGSHGGGWSSNQAAFDVGIDDHGSYADFWSPNGGVLRFTSTGGGNYTAPAGANMTLFKNGSFGDFVYTITLNRTGDKYLFSGTGYLTRTADRNDVGEYFNYSIGNMVMAAHENGRYITYDWDESGVLRSQSDSAGRTTSYGYDSSGRLNKVTAYDGKVTEHTYDSTGRLATMKVPSADGAGTTLSTFGYDTSHRVVSVTQKTNSATWGAGTDAVTAFAYTAGQTVVTDALGRATTYTIDAQGRQTSAKDALNRTRSATWNANSEVTTNTDALTAGNVTNFEFDSSNNATSAKLPTGAAASAVYTAGAGCSGSGGTGFQVKCSTDPAGNSSAYQYDSAGNPTQKTNTSASGAVEFKYVYESAARTVCGGHAGQICSATDGNGKITSYSYNSAGDLTKVTPPAPLGATFYVVDSLGRVTQTTDGRGDVYIYGYDVRDRNTTTSFSGGTTTTTTYFGNGLVQTITDGNASTSYQYDAQGRTTRQTGPGSGVASSSQHDKVGNLISFQEPTGTVTYQYNAANELTSVKQPGGTCPASGNPASGSGCVLFQYDANGTESKRIFPGGSAVTTTRDTAGRATRITATGGNGIAVADVSYSFTAPGTTTDRDSIQTRTSHLEQGVAPGAVTTYTYDSYKRLTLAQEKVGTSITASWSYEYDGAGNRTRQTRTGSTGTAAATVAYTYNSANQITSTTADTTTWSFDGAGNQVRNGISGGLQMIGSRGQVTQSLGTAQTYFNDGNATRLTAGSDTFTNSALGVTKRASGSTALNIIRTPDGAAISYKGGADSHYYASDGLGSVIALFSQTGSAEGGYSYSPFGEPRASATATAVASNPIRYIGGYWEGGSTYKLGSRFYDSSLGRFTQMDPTGQEDSPYAYSNNDPTNQMDPSGEVAFLAPLVVAGLRVVVGQALSTTARAAAGRLAARGIGAIGRGALNRSVNRASSGVAQAMNKGRVRIGASTRVGSRNPVNAIRVYDWHYYLTGPKY